MFRAPIQIDLDITHGCNLQCIHCSADAGIKLKDEMTYEEIKDFIDEIYEWGVMNITIAGGEPLLRTDCLDILKYAISKRGMMVTLVTNGLLLTQEMIRDIAENCKGLQLVISLDAPNQQMYDVIRKGNHGTFEEVIEKIKMIALNEISYSVSYVVTKLNIGSFFDTYMSLNKLGIDKLTVIKFIPVGRGEQNRSILELDKEVWEKFVLYLTEEKKSGNYKNLALSVACPNDLYIPLMKVGYSEQDVEKIWNYVSPLKIDSYKEFRELGCHAGITNLSVSANGNVYPCAVGVSYEEMICGNIREGKIKDIWKFSKLLNYLRELKLKDLDSECIICNYKSICGGGCRIRAFVNKKKMNDKDLACCN